MTLFIGHGKHDASVGHHRDVCVHEHGGNAALVAGRIPHQSLEALLSANETPCGSTRTNIKKSGSIAPILGA